MGPVDQLPETRVENLITQHAMLRSAASSVEIAKAIGDALSLREEDDQEISSEIRLALYNIKEHLLGVVEGAMQDTIRGFERRWMEERRLPAILQTLQRLQFCLEERSERDPGVPNEVLDYATLHGRFSLPLDETDEEDGMWAQTLDAVVRAVRKVESLHVVKK